MTNDDEVFGRRDVTGAARWMRLLIAAGVIALAVIAAWWFSRGEDVTSEAEGHEHGATVAGGEPQPVLLDEEQARRIGVTYATVERSVLRQEVRTVAQVAYDETRVRTVSLKFEGWVERLFVDFTGQDVRAGDPLLSTYAPMLVSAAQELVNAAQLMREVAEADSATRASAEQLRASARQRLLYWDVPAEEVERVERTGEIPKSLVIRAPYSGVIVDKFVQEGQRIMAGDPLYRIADLSTVWVEGEVFERDLPLVKLGQSVDIEMDALPGASRSGRIVFVQPTINAETRTTRIRVELDNTGRQLRPGMFATVKIGALSATPVLHVPRSAVLSTGRRDVVFVRLADGMLEPRNVERGITTADRVEIRSGLKAGETVVASATFLIDAESNLGTALSAMAAMPGTDAATPRPVAPDSSRERP